MSGHDWIADDLFREIHRVSVIACVDVVCVRHDTVLLLKREVEPAKGQWWFPGGRIRKGETILTAARRIVLEEVGLQLEDISGIGFDEIEFQEDPFGHGKGTQTLNVILRARPEERIIALDARHSAYHWLLLPLRDDDRVHTYVRHWILGACRA